MQHKGLLSSQRNEISASCEWEVTVIFPFYRANEHWCSRASHNGPSCSTYIIKSPWTVACPVESPGASEWTFCIYNHFPHFSQMHHTSLPESPRHSRYSYKTSFYNMSSTFHANQEHQDWAQLSYEPLGFLGKNLESLDVSQPQREQWE